MDLSWLQEQSTLWKILSAALMNSPFHSLNNKLATTVLFQGETHGCITVKHKSRKISIQQVSLFSFAKPRWVIEMQEKDSVGCQSAFIH